MPLKQNTSCRHYQSNKSSRKLHRRVINERDLQEQLNMMKLSIADLESADSFGSLSVDCDIDEGLRDIVEADQPTRARKRRKSALSEVSSKADGHSRTRRSLSDKQVAPDIEQEKEVKRPYQTRQPALKRSQEHRISVPLVQSSEHLELYNKFSDKKSLPDFHPNHKDWSEKFGSLSDDVDKFLDKYVADDAKRYSCLIT